MKPKKHKISDADMNLLLKYPKLVAESEAIRRKLIRRYSFQTFYRTLREVRRGG